MRKGFVVLAAAICLAAIVPASVSAAKLPRDFYGVVTQGPIYPFDGFLMNVAGVGTLRAQFDWRNVQTVPGRCQSAAETGICEWRFTDYIVGNMAAWGVRTFPYLLNVPGFINPDSNTPPIRSKKDKAAWEGYLDALVKRYGRGGQYWKRYYPQQFPSEKPLPITHWEIWNEPSDGSYWKPKPDPEEYAKLLEISGRAIHKAQPSADVVFAGLFGTPDPKNNGIKAFTYYKRAFARKNLGKYFDDIAVHPYGPTLKRVNVQMDWVLEEMRAAGFRNRDIWVTEIAWSSDEPPVILGVGPEGQAELLKKSFALFRKNRAKWNIAGLHWYAYQDLDPGVLICQFCDKAGLVTYDRQAKPSYNAFRSVAGG